MTRHPSSHATHEESAVKDVKKSTTHVPLPPIFQALEMIAKKKYSPYMDIAARFDDAQEVFSSKMTNFLKGNNLTTRVALLAASLAQEKA